MFKKVCLSVLFAFCAVLPFAQVSAAAPDVKDNAVLAWRGGYGGWGYGGYGGWGGYGRGYGGYGYGGYGYPYSGYGYGGYGSGGCSNCGWW